MAERIIRLRYAGSCSRCGIALSIGSQARWDASARATRCIECPDLDAVSESPPNMKGSSVSRADGAIPLDAGQAGRSARREYETRHARRAEHIDQRWGPLASVVKFLSDDPQSTKAWAKGSDGERRLAERLTRLVGGRSVLLHDRKVPRTRGNIDHIVVAASGVWVIDTKHYDGRVEQRDVGRWFKTDHRLYVGGRDRTKAADGLAWQVDAVRDALSPQEVPVHAALCFIDADWKLFAKPFQQGVVWVTWPKKLGELVAAPGPLTCAAVRDVAARLAVALPPATTS